MHTYRLRMGFFMLLAFLAWEHMPFQISGWPTDTLITAGFAQGRAEGETKEPDIQWFREEMKISPKYMERKEGMLGMSWTHFFTMLFLVLFFLGSLAALVIRSRRTKQLLNRLLKEERDGADG